MLSRVTVENFRSLEKVRVELAPLTALAGANGTGKSSILRAIDLVLGQRWPTVNSLSFPHDFTAGEDTRSLRIAVRLTVPYVHRDVLGEGHAVHGFQVVCKPYKVRTARADRGDPNFDYEPLADDGKPPQSVALSRQNKKPVFGPLIKVSSEMRPAADVMFIDHRRSLRDHHPWARGSILARLLGPARKELAAVSFDNARSHAEEFSVRYQEAMEALRTPRVREIETTISRTARRTLGSSARRRWPISTCGSASRTLATRTGRCGSTTASGAWSCQPRSSALGCRARSWSGSSRPSGS